jgi:WD domain, G-beta repeat
MLLSVSSLSLSGAAAAELGRSAAHHSGTATGGGMRVIKVGGDVVLVRFLPDGRRLLVGTASPDLKVGFSVWPVDGATAVRADLPALDLPAWRHAARHGNVVGIEPAGEFCFVACAGELHAFRTEDGATVPAPVRLPCHQIALSPAGDRLLLAQMAGGENRLVAVAVRQGGSEVLWKKELRDRFCHLAGVLPDGERFVLIDRAARIAKMETGEDQTAAALYPQNGREPTQGQLSPAGRHVGAVVFSTLYVLRTPDLSGRRMIGGTRSSGEVRGFAFHPDGKQLAVLQGGQRQVKMYDLSTQAEPKVYQWRIGRLGCVTFSADGLLGAVGSRDGRVLLWDVDG